MPKSQQFDVRLNLKGVQKYRTGLLQVQYGLNGVIRSLEGLGIEMDDNIKKGMEYIRLITSLINSAWGLGTALKALIPAQWASAAASAAQNVTMAGLAAPMVASAIAVGLAMLGIHLGGQAGIGPIPTNIPTTAGGGAGKQGPVRGR